MSGDLSRSEESWADGLKEAEAKTWCLNQGLEQISLDGGSCKASL